MIDIKDITNDVLIQKISDYWKNQLRESGWMDLLKGFTSSMNFEAIIYELIELSRDNRTFSPTVSKVFSAFVNCPYNKVKLIWVNNEPYNSIVSNGIAFGVCKPEYRTNTLIAFNNEMNRTLYDNQKKPEDFDSTIVNISQQGVLMLNSSLTSDPLKDNRHHKIWKEFITYLFDMLSNKGLLWVLTDDRYQHLLEDETFYSVPIKNKSQRWDCLDIFNTINKKLKEKNQEQVNWL